MKTFFAFLESVGSDDLMTLIHGFEDLGLQERVWDETQITHCLDTLNWDDALTFSVEDFTIQWGQLSEAKTKTSLDGSEFALKPVIEGSIGAKLNTRSLGQTLVKTLQSQPQTTHTENLFTLAEILAGWDSVNWSRAWARILEDINQNFQSWVNIKMETKVSDYKSSAYPIHIYTEITLDDSGQPPFDMEELDPGEKVLEAIKEKKI